jgi:hypothetical protein
MSQACRSVIMLAILSLSLCISTMERIVHLVSEAKRSAVKIMDENLPFVVGVLSARSRSDRESEMFWHRVMN